VHFVPMSAVQVSMVPLVPPGMLWLGLLRQPQENLGRNGFENCVHFSCALRRGAVRYVEKLPAGWPEINVEKEGSFASCARKSCVDVVTLSPNPMV